MSDRRLTPANGRVAAESLRGVVDALAYVAGEPAQVTAPVADLRCAPDGPRDRQLVSGAAVTVFERRGGWGFVQADRDGYVGYVRETELGPARAATHWVSARASHAYAAPDLKSPDLKVLMFGSRVHVVATRAGFCETGAGDFVPAQHLWPLDRVHADPVAVAEMHLGVPYLWGGNSVLGIDCSGLVQASLWASGIVCPGDSDQQEAALGRALDKGAPMQRGDLMFWPGHVAMATDPDTVIHANAHAMAVSCEPLARVLERIERVEGNALRSRRRLSPRQPAT